MNVAANTAPSLSTTYNAADRHSFHAMLRKVCIMTDNNEYTDMILLVARYFPLASKPVWINELERIAAERTRVGHLETTASGRVYAIDVSIRAELKATIHPEDFSALVGMM
jgi:hypothetical protein